MEEITSPETPSPSEKIYSNRAILASTFWAGPVVGGYMLSENFKVFGERKRAMWALILSILGMIILLGLLMTVSFLERVPNIVFPAIYTWIFYFIIRGFLAENMDAHFKAGGERVGLGKVILVGAIGGILTAGIAFGGFYLYTSATDKTVTKYFGALKHEIQYDPGNITEEEVDRVGKALTDTTYFDSEMQKFVDIRKDSGKYEVFLYCDESIKKDRRVYEAYVELHSDVQRLFPDNKIIFNLVIGTPDNVARRIE